MIRTLLLAFVLFYSGVYSQSLVNTFFDKNGKVSDSVSSYYYQRARKDYLFIEGANPNLVMKSDKGHKGLAKNSQRSVDTIFSYYTATGKIRDRRIFVNGSIEGSYIAYHENGKIKEKGIYYQGRRIGYFTSWYQQGIPEESVQYLDSMKTYFPWPKVINHWDSLGKQEVSNGNGFCRCYRTFHFPGDDASEVVREEGKIVNGLKDSVWMVYRHDTLIFKEDYRGGKFLEGTGYSNGEEYRFTEIQQQPEFPEGMEGMMRFLEKNMRYPKEARRRDIQGRVFVGFIVNANGQIDKVEIMKGIGRDLDAEAARVVTIMPRWKPGKLRGVPVKVRFVLPINFKLED